jgi:hydrogenase maturation protein HypF
MTALVTSVQPIRRSLRVTGVVQGVGFRPFVYRLAVELGLSGYVGNDAAGVFISVEGPEGLVTEFEGRLFGESPPLAIIRSIEGRGEVPEREQGFRIVESPGGGPSRTCISPDIAVCGDCLGELHDPADRRYRYPFINCTNCGPRFTITRRVPYDRPNTTMAGFPLCPACVAEYGDPRDRRFHAQPVACPGCGPRIWFEDHGLVTQGTDSALAAAQRALAQGAIVAIKGLGGFHLACDATSDAAVQRLRELKHRPHKPFAVMVPNVVGAIRFAQVDQDERRLIESPQRPIVLLRALVGTALSDRVAPENTRIGLLLPYTPVHHLLFERIPDVEAPIPEALVMTSGNLTDEPICFDDEDAQQRLGDIADYWLLHNRPIHVPCDDSVVQISDGRELPIRRSRGYAPLPVGLSFQAPAVLATGGELKNTFCLASGTEAFLSQHIGDMGSVETWSAFERSVGQLEEIYEIAPVVIAADAHPGYQIRRWAEEHSALDMHLVQHHHAHVASVMAEHGVPLEQPVIGFAFDGTGYGDDGTIWGGEVLIASYGAFERAGHLKAVPLPGGDSAIRHPARVALSHLWSAGIPWNADLAPVRATTEAERRVLARQLERGVCCVPTSSMGRLFDAVSSILDVCQVTSYEAQAAIELEWKAGPVEQARPYVFAVDAGVIDPAPVLRDLIADQRAGVSLAASAAGFHLAVAQMVALEAMDLRHRTGIETVALSGGVFQNTKLLELTEQALVPLGFRVLTHRVVPPNDGGLALGQAAVAAAQVLAGSDLAW